MSKERIVLKNTYDKLSFCAGVKAGQKQELERLCQDLINWLTENQTSAGVEADFVFKRINTRLKGLEAKKWVNDIGFQVFN